MKNFFKSKQESDGKFGTIKGVFIPNVLQMIGVILFLRLGVVLGHAGIAQMTIIISLSALLLFLTALSLGSIVSNMRMEGGGSYYLVSRALGAEFGTAIGILGAVTQLCSTALCVTGFAISLQEFLPSVPLIVLQASTLTTLVLLSYLSTDLALKTQIFIFVALAVSVGSIFFGSVPTPENLVASTEPASLTFWTCFAMFFPAMTGIETGMSMSGDLKNPSRSLPIGTFGAVGVVYLIYLGTSFFLSTFVDSAILRANPFILFYISKVGYLIVMGVWAATLSSALGNVLGGPRIIQAIAKDGILPKFLAKGYGPTNEPRIATIVVYILSMVILVGADIDQIIPMLTMSCLISYSLINFIAFFESFVQNPSYRPTLKTHWTLSLFGSVACLIAMFMINPGAAFAEIALVTIFCAVTARRNIGGNWDDLKHSIFSFFVHKGTIRLSQLKASPRSWRPHILTLFDSVSVDKNLAYFSHALNQGKGLLTFGVNVPSNEEYLKSQQSLKDDLQGFKIPSHLHLNVCPDPLLGNDQMIRNYGFGLLQPNTVILANPTDDKIESTIHLLLQAHSQHKNILILKGDALKDYLFTDPTRKSKQINLWWKGKYAGNFDLCLALAYLLQQSKLWPKSKISIRMIAKNLEMKDKWNRQFNKHRTELRIDNLDFSPIIDEKEEFFTNFISKSEGVDLTFLGLKKPDEDTSAQEYADYYRKLLKETQEVPNIAFVLCGEKLEFRNIFRD